MEASSADSELANTQPTQRRSTWRWASLIVLGMLTPLVLPVGWIEWRIAAIENKMRASGVPVTRQELNNYRTRADQTDDSAHRWKELDLQWQAAYDHLSREDDQLLQKPWEIPEYSQPWDNLAQVDLILVRLRPVLAAYQDQLGLPGQSWDQHSEGPDRRDLFRAFTCDLRVSIHQGDFDRAFRAMKSLVGLAEAERGCADVISFLGLLAFLGGIQREMELALNHVTWTDSQLFEIQKRLCAINLHEEMRFSQAGSVIGDGEHITE